MTRLLLQLQPQHLLYPGLELIGLDGCYQSGSNGINGMAQITRCHPRRPVVTAAPCQGVYQCRLHRSRGLATVLGDIGLSGCNEETGGQCIVDVLS